MKKQIKNIEKMEIILDTMEEKINNLEKSLNDFENYLDEFKKLEEYYGSEQWFIDKDTKFPKSLKCWVLSENAIYNLITNQREIWIRMAKLWIKVVE